MMIDWRRPQPGPSVIRKLLLANLSLVNKVGIYNDRNIAGSTKKSHHAEGRAIDIYLNAFLPHERDLGDRLFQAFIDCATDVGADEVIWNRQIWSPRRPTIRHYNGKKAHTDHIHVGITREGSQRREFGMFAGRLAQIRSELEIAASVSSRLV